MIYVLIDTSGTPLADPDSAEVYTFRTEADARQLARPGETVAGWVPDPTGHFGARKTVQLPTAGDRRG